MFNDREFKPIRQPLTQACWATVLTMMINWRDGTDLDIAEMMERLGPPWPTRFRSNNGLTSDEQRQLETAVGLVAEPPASYMTESYAEFVETSGPVWITTGSLFSQHAWLLVDVEVANPVEDTRFVYVDPLTGSVHSAGWANFHARFEQQAREIVNGGHDIDFVWQILHLPPS